MDEETAGYLKALQADGNFWPAQWFRAQIKKRYEEVILKETKDE